MQVATQLGRYVLERLLNVDDVEQVWFATIAGSGDFQTNVVVKTSAMPSDMYSKRLEEEGRIGCILNHPGLAKIYEFGHSNSLPFIAREYVRGCCLETVCAQQNNIQPYFVLSVLVDVCAALQYAHENSNAIHGNLQLSKIVVSYTGEVRLLDFGHSIDKYIPKPYSAPEHTSQKNSDVRSDVYDLGILLYLALTGSSLPTKMSRDELEHTINTSLVDSNLDTKTSKHIVAIIVKAVSQAPKDRYSTVGELGIDLSACIANRGPSRHERAMLMASSGAKDVPGYIRKRYRQHMESEIDVIGDEFVVLLDDEIPDNDLPAPPTLSVLPKLTETPEGHRKNVAAPPVNFVPPTRTQLFASVPNISLVQDTPGKSNVFGVPKNSTESTSPLTHNSHNTRTHNVFVGRRRIEPKSSTQDLFGGNTSIDGDADDWPWEPSLLDQLNDE